MQLLIIADDQTTEFSLDGQTFTASNRVQLSSQPNRNFFGFRINVSENSSTISSVNGHEFGVAVYAVGSDECSLVFSLKCAQPFETEKFSDVSRRVFRRDLQIEMAALNAYVDSLSQNVTPGEVGSRDLTQETGQKDFSFYAGSVCAFMGAILVVLGIIHHARAPAKKMSAETRKSPPGVQERRVPMEIVAAAGNTVIDVEANQSSVVSNPITAPKLR